jgi:hypothetical protein
MFYVTTKCSSKISYSNGVISPSMIWKNRSRPWSYLCFPVVVGNIRATYNMYKFIFCLRSTFDVFSFNLRCECSCYVLHALYTLSTRSELNQGSLCSINLPHRSLDDLSSQAHDLGRPILDFGGLRLVQVAMNTRSMRFRYDPNVLASIFTLNRRTFLDQYSSEWSPNAVVIQTYVRLTDIVYT